MATQRKASLSLKNVPYQSPKCFIIQVLQYGPKRRKGGGRVCVALGIVRKGERRGGRAVGRRVLKRVGGK